MFKSALFILLCAGILLTPPTAHAASINALWNGTSDSNWTNSANWSSGSVPNNGTDVFTVSITSTTGNPVTLGGNAVISSLLMSGTALSMGTGVTLTLDSGSSTLTGAQLTGGILVNRGALGVAGSTSLTGTLQNAAGGTVEIQNGAGLWLSTGTHTNNGTVNLAGTTSMTSLGLNGATGTTVTLNGSGVINLGGVQNGITSSGAGLENGAGHTIRGAGAIAPNALTNHGTILADGGQLVLAPYSLTNDSVIAANPTGTLLLGSSTIANAGGVIRADGGTVTFGGSNLTGGTVEAVNGGTVSLTGIVSGATVNAGAGSTLSLASGTTVSASAVNVTGTLNMDSATLGDSTLTNSGTVHLSGGLNQLSGTLNNNSGGVVNLNTGATLLLADNVAYTNNGTFNLTSAAIQLSGSSGTATLNGSGVVNLNAAGFLSNGSTLVNGAGHTIRGTGGLNSSALLVNHGSIVGSGGTLNLTPYSLTNDGLIATDNTGTLQCSAAINNAGGTIRADGGTVLLGGGVSGGTLAAVNGGTLSLYGSTQNATLNVSAGSTLTLSAAQVAGSTLNVSGTLEMKGGQMDAATTLTNSGIVKVTDSAARFAGTLHNNAGAAIDVSGVPLTLVAGGTYNNNGTIDLSGMLTLSGGGSGVTIGGSGAINLNGGGILTPDATGLLNGAGHTIRGVGGIATGSLANHGAILADGAGNLYLTSANVTNDGLMAATGSGALYLVSSGPGSSVDNTGGTIRADGGTVHLLGTVTGGTVQAVNGGTLNLMTVTLSGSTLDVAGTANVTYPGSLAGTSLLNRSGSNINVADGVILSLAADGSYTNNGAINLNSGSSASGLELSGNNGTVTLGGSGVLNMNGTLSQISEAGTNLTLANASGHTIRGTGYIGNTGSLTMSNAGTITASGGGALVIDASSMTNTGTLAVEAGSVLVLTGSGFSNFNSTDGKLAGGTYDVAGTFIFKGADIVTNQANLTLRGSSWSVKNERGENGIANLAANAAGGSFALRESASFVTSGQFTNSREVVVDSGSDFTATGGYVQAGGATRVDGTLVGDVSLQGGRLSGTGTIDGNLSNARYVAPGNSPGTLTVDGDYSQTAAGALEIEILNALVYDRLVVNGMASLAGTLRVTLLPGYVLHSGDRFTVMTFSSLSGTFDTLDLPGPYWSSRFTANSLELEYTTPEPAAWSLMAAGTLLLWWRRRAA